jgi:HPt (histidine-containing phosphotransfer) domain-containing protein
MTKNNRKEKFEIKIDSEEAIENFGSETFEQNIVLFVEESYNHFKEGIKKAQEEQDKAKMKIMTHTLKTTARYMSSENFALECQSIESETKDPNWDKINQLLPDFFEDLDILYNECLKFYNEIKGIKKPEEIRSEIQDNHEAFEHSEINAEVEHPKSTLKSSKTCNEEVTNLVLENDQKSRFQSTFSSKNLMQEKNNKLEKTNLSNSFISKPNIILVEDANYGKSPITAQKNVNYRGVQMGKIDQLSPIHDTMNKTDKYNNLLSEGKDAFKNLPLNDKNAKNSNSYNLGVSTPQISSSNFEVNKIKIELTDRTESLSFKNLEDETNKKKSELSHSNSTSNLNSSMKNPKNCIKSLRDIDKPTTTGSYFKPKLDDKPKIAMTNSEFKSKFFVNL